MRAHHQDRKIRESVHEAMQGRAVRSAGHPQVHEGRERAHSAQAICLGHGSGGDRGEPPVPERLGEIVGQRGIILDDCDEAISPSGAEELDQPVEGRGFRQHGKQTFLPRGEQIVLSGVSGDHDRRQPGVDPSDLVHQTRAAHHGHAHVGNERIEAGTVMVNEVLYTHGVAQTPWGGVKDSGYGRTHGRMGLLELVIPQHIHVNRIVGLDLGHNLTADLLPEINCVTLLFHN